MKHYDVTITLKIDGTGETEEEAINDAIDYLNSHSIEYYIDDSEAEPNGEEE